MEQALATMEETAGQALVTLRQQLADRADEFRMVLPSHITPEKLQRTILTAVQANPVLLQCDRRTFLTACMKAAQDGLLPDGREAAIVPFNTRQKTASGWQTVRLAQYMPMAFGLRKKILQSGEIRDLFASVVYRQEIEAGRFHYEEGTARDLRHRPIVDPDFRPTDADVALAYSVATFADGGLSFEIMRRWEIDHVREMSQTGGTLDKDGQPREAKGPWVEWFGEMAKKTVIRRHSKSLPQSGDVIADVEGADIDAAARSAMALLDSRPPDPPAQIVDWRGEGPVRPAGEADQPAATDTGPYPGPGAAHPETAPEAEAAAPKPRQRRRQQAAPEAEPEPLAEPPQPAPVEPPADPEPDLPVDQMGITNDGPDSVARFWITRARNCEFLLDLNKAEADAEADLRTMDPQTAAEVDHAFDLARVRLDPKASPKAPASA